MTKEQKIKLLTGATVAVLDAETDRFLHFHQLSAIQANACVSWEQIGVSASGNLWIMSGGLRYVVVDEKLAIIAE